MSLIYRFVFCVCLCVPAVHSGIPSDQSSGTSSPLCDSGLHLNYHPNNTVLFLLAISWLTVYITVHLCRSARKLFPCNCHCSLRLYLYLLRVIQLPSLCLACAPAATTALSMCWMYWKAPFQIVFHTSYRTRCPARPGPRPPDSAGRRDGWTCASSPCCTHTCLSTTRALTSAGELLVACWRVIGVCSHLQSWCLAVRLCRN